MFASVFVLQDAVDGPVEKLCGVDRVEQTVAQDIGCIGLTQDDAWSEVGAGCCRCAGVDPFLSVVSGSIDDAVVDVTGG